jgi:hypothetical protein
VNGDLDLSICAIVHDVHLLCRFALSSLCFGADVCAAGKLSQRAATTGREGYDCANGGDSWFHVERYRKHERRDQMVKQEGFRGENSFQDGAWRSTATFLSPDESWLFMAGRAGYAIVRQGEVMDAFITILS